jgi:hypothetical protein
VAFSSHKNEISTSPSLGQLELAADLSSTPDSMNILTADRHQLFYPSEVYPDA